MKAKTLTQLFLAIVLAGSPAVHAVERSILVTVEGGKSATLFTIGDSRCVLVDDQIVCTRTATK